MVVAIMSGLMISGHSLKLEIEAFISFKLQLGYT